MLFVSGKKEKTTRDVFSLIARNSVDLHRWESDCSMKAR